MLYGSRNGEARGSQHRLSIPYFLVSLKLKRWKKKKERMMMLLKIFIPHLVLRSISGPKMHRYIIQARETNGEEIEMKRNTSCSYDNAHSLLYFSFNFFYCTFWALWRNILRRIGTGWCFNLFHLFWRLAKTTVSQFLRKYYIMYLNAWCMRLAAPAPTIEHPAYT